MGIGPFLLQFSVPLSPKMMLKTQNSISQSKAVWKAILPKRLDNVEDSLARLESREKNCIIQSRAMINFLKTSKQNMQEL